VVGTLWFAEDQTTQEIMSEFFSNLANFDTPEAMRQAQLGYLKRNAYEYTQFPRHPYFWAVSGIFGQ
ncbi:MAG: CHAT domain-containing protein, partial [Desulfobacterales bacterium]|nr:CHAT domain-containing protein [Candidatus Desulfatibia vada]